jgi:hypothetical protein
MTKDEVLGMMHQAAILIQGDDSYRVDCVIDDTIHMTNEETGEEHLIEWDDIDVVNDIIYGLCQLNK